ncbi:SusC/RagA family TonB-linked outer membrane protein [Persicitalea jodogahamensis]|uniref:SusC/RagA family TonB-linked outer membrane protein n=1 Tax=Persicitalea jodogahamensis TaxID=402147 RepID=A0A8J3D855_9BACT|nr:TonB-dependent receptor [Persicitalea jodogahamensis]GHB86514.1 SusC/RagA family TonB-linked outer membrane protein [Persicitalea jodogahamensis]
MKKLDLSIKPLVLACGLLASGLPSPGVAQAVLASSRAKQVNADTPKQRAVSLRQALKTLEERFSIRFGYDSRLLDNKPTVILPGNDNLIASLSSLLTPLGIHYEHISPTVYVLSTLPTAAAPTSAALERRVSGRVMASDNAQPLPGVSITLKGSARGTTTDAEGRYELNVPDAGGVLVFSFVGYLAQEVAVGNKNTLDVTLSPDLKALDEVVVVGYGTAQQGDLTSSITSLKAKDLQNQPVTSPDALLQGKAAGVQVVQNSGTPAGEIFIRIRGTASLLGETRPLYVVDGVPLNNFGGTVLDAGGQRQSALADINPNDIESIDILKDAAAAAIYGARGSNGVVLITTKRGKSGKARFNFDAYTGVQSVTKKLDVLNGDQYVELLRESLTNRGRNPLTEFPFSQVVPTGTTTNYQNEIFRTAPISNYNLSVAGGNERVNTFASLGYFNQKGTIIGQDYKRYNLRVNLDYQATDQLKFGTSTLLSNALQNRVANDFSGFSILANSLTRNPNLPVRNADGTYSVDPLNNENPVLLANEILAESNQKRVISNLYAEYAFLKNLTFRTTFGIDYLADRQQRYVPSYVIARNGRAEAQAVSSDQFTWVTDNTLTYQQRFGSHRVSVLAGTGFQRSASNFLQTGGQTAGSNIIKTIAIADPYIPFQNVSEWALLSYFGRASYNFQDKYLVDASFRVDGSSRFGANKRYGVFPALSAGWRISEEPFLKDNRIINDLKLRAGYGVTGNQEGLGGDYPALALYSTGRNYDGNPGIGQANIPNPELGWESTAAANAGLDMSLLNNRLSLTADVYLKRTNDLIFERQLPYTSGFGGIGNANIGSMENKGLEFTINTVNLAGPFKWNTNFNISFNRNRITSLPDNGRLGSDFIFKLPDTYGVEGPYSIYRIGQSVGNFYGYTYLGVYASDEDVPRIDDPEKKVTDLYERGVRGGEAAFLDVNNDGFISRADDRVLIGNALPKFIGGLTNTFSYKGLEISVVMNWSYGNKIYNMTRAVLTGMIEDLNQSTETLRRWQKPGDITDVPKALYGSSSVSGASPTDVSSRYLEDGSFLRFRNITLSYNLPKTFIQRIGLNNLRLYVSGQNLITITDYKGFDPESQNTGGGRIPSLGVDYLTQPQARVMTGGLSVSF